MTRAIHINPQKGHIMNSATFTRLLLKPALPALLAILAPAAICQAQAASNMEKVDIVKEGIDLEPIYVDARASGYTGSENKGHKYLVRVFAKAKGQNRVWKVMVHGYKSGGGPLFQKDVGKSEGWAVYGKSLEIYSKPGNMGWMTTPKTACDNLLKKKMAEGMSKADVLKNDRKTTALAFVGFTAYADSKGNNKASVIGGHLSPQRQCGLSGQCRLPCSTLR
jgi:hypothetical protein